MKFAIKNFTNADTLKINVSEGLSGHGPLVCVYCGEGSLSMQHSMTPAQAREMAAALVACADVQEAPVNVDFSVHRAGLEVQA